MSDEKLVFCKKYNKELPALEKAPMQGSMGELIRAHISAQAWADWLEAQIKIINEQRLDLSDEKAQKRLYEQMLEYLNLDK